MIVDKCQELVVVKVALWITMCKHMTLSLHLETTFYHLMRVCNKHRSDDRRDMKTTTLSIIFRVTYYSDSHNAISFYY